MTCSSATWRLRGHLQLFPAVKIWHGDNNTKSVCRRGFMWNFVGDRCRIPTASSGRSMCVWRASFASLEGPRSVTERPKYEQRRIALLTLWATPDKRYDANKRYHASPRCQTRPRPRHRPPDRTADREADSANFESPRIYRSRFPHVRPASRGLRHFATCSTKLRISVEMYLQLSLSRADYENFEICIFLRTFVFSWRDRNLWLRLIFNIV